MSNLLLYKGGKRCKVATSRFLYYSFFGDLLLVLFNKMAYIWMLPGAVFYLLPRNKTLKLRQVIYIN